MRELVHVQGGRYGNQIGAKFWEVISDVHAALTLCGPQASDYQMSDVCSVCHSLGSGSALRFYRPRHHCEACGISVCGSCSTQSVLIGVDRHRVCDPCALGSSLGTTSPSSSSGATDMRSIATDCTTAPDMMIGALPLKEMPLREIVPKNGSPRKSQTVGLLRCMEGLRCCCLSTRMGSLTLRFCANARVWCQTLRFNGASA